MARYIVYRAPTALDVASYAFGSFLGRIIRATFASFLISSTAVLSSVAFVAGHPAPGLGFAGVTCLTLAYLLYVRRNYAALLAPLAFAASSWALLQGIGFLSFVIFLGTWGSIVVGGFVCKLILDRDGERAFASEQALEPPMVIARYSGDGCHYVGRALERRGDHISVQFGPGSVEWVAAAHVTADDLSPGEMVAAFHHGMGQWHPAQIVRRDGSVVVLQFANGVTLPASVLSLRLSRYTPTYSQRSHS